MFSFETTERGRILALLILAVFFLFFPLLPRGYVGVILLAVLAYAALLLLVFSRWKISLVLRPLGRMFYRISDLLAGKVKGFAGRISGQVGWLLDQKKSYLLLAVLIFSNVMLETLRLWLLLAAFGVAFDFFLAAADTEPGLFGDGPAAQPGRPGCDRTKRHHRVSEFRDCPGNRFSYCLLGSVPGYQLGVCSGWLLPSLPADAGGSERVGDASPDQRRD